MAADITTGRLDAAEAAAHAGDRFTALFYMQAMDPNGTWADSLSDAEGIDHVSLAEVLRTIARWRRENC